MQSAGNLKSYNGGNSKSEWTWNLTLNNKILTLNILSSRISCQVEYQGRYSVLDPSTGRYKVQILREIFHMKSRKTASGNLQMPGVSKSMGVQNETSDRCLGRSTELSEIPTLEEKLKR